MDSFGKKLRECRETKNLSQNELARLIEAHHSIIGKYERDEVKPSIDVVKKIANILDTTVGYLLGESQDTQFLKDPTMMQRLNDISKFPDNDKEHVLYTLDAMIRDIKTRQAYATR
jgi:transcriptional regulator with XRE-family HTH domain